MLFFFLESSRGVGQWWTARLGGPVRGSCETPLVARAEHAEWRHGACELAAPAKRRTPAPAEAIVYNGQILRASVPPRSTLTDALSASGGCAAAKQGFV